MFPRKLRFEIAALLCAKAIMLLCIYQLFFAPLVQPEPDGRAMRAHLIAASQPGN